MNKVYFASHLFNDNVVSFTYYKGGNTKCVYNLVEEFKPVEEWKVDYPSSTEVLVGSYWLKTLTPPCMGR